jgi:hypothetical protein
LLAQRNERNLKPAIDLASLLVSRKAPKPLGLMERHMPSKFALIAAILIVGSPLPIQAHDLYSHLVHQFSFWVFGMRRCGLARVGEIEALLSRAGAVEA